MGNILDYVSDLFWLILLSSTSFWWSYNTADPQFNYARATSTAHVVKVIDGDTIDVRIIGQDEVIRVRYIGIDTPEPYATKVPECGSVKATARNQELLTGETITLVPGIDPYDQYDRLLAYVYAGETFVNEVLVQEGYATVLMIEPNTEFSAEFTNHFDQAQRERLGIWSACLPESP